MPARPTNREYDSSQVTRAAWLHFAAGLTQGEVARRLGITSVKAHRLISRASQQGVVKVTIVGDIVECFELEAALTERYRLDYCEVAPDLHQADDDQLPLSALGIVGARFLQQEIDSGQHQLIGLGYGRTLSACVDQLARTEARGVRFVSLLGGMTQNYATGPHEVTHRLARSTGTEAFVMPVPFYANSIEDRNVLLGQRGIQSVMELARNTSLKLVGIGTASVDASLVDTGMVDRDEIAAVRKAGATGELLGHFFDAQGRMLSTALSDRTMGLPLKDLQATRIVAIAGGTRKMRAISSVLQSRRLSGLITDERTARALIESGTRR